MSASDLEPRLPDSIEAAAEEARSVALGMLARTGAWRLLEQLWLLLPGLFPRHRRVRSSRKARHLIRTLRLRLAKLGKDVLGADELGEEN